MADTNPYMWHQDAYVREANLAWRRCQVVFAARGAFNQTHPTPAGPGTERSQVLHSDPDRGEGGVPLPPS